MEKRELYRFQKERELPLILLDFTIIVRIGGLHSPDVWFIFCFSQNKTHSARYWKDPHTFNPSRFLAADWPRDAFMPFSSGEKWESFFWHDIFIHTMKSMQEPVHALVESISFFFKSKKAFC
jgi:hypothetical protein